MDSNISVFSIQDEFKFSEQVLKRLSTEDLQSPPTPECYSELKEVKEIPGVRYRMFLDIKMKNNVLYFSPMLVLYNLKSQRIRGTLAFYVKSANYASPFSSKLFKHALFNSTTYGHDYEICSLEDLFNPEKKFIVDGECCIEMKGIFRLESSNEKCESKQTLGQYLWNRNDHDFTILVGKENESKTEIKVHKCVLGARSPVFDSMLYTNMKEKAHNIVEIIDFDVQTVKNAIAFCYDQESEESAYLLYDVTDSITLLQFADKYNIQDLKNELQEALETILLPENICEIANGSIISNSPKLHEHCIQTMLMFSKMEIPIDNIEILDKDIALEFMKKTFSSKK